ncbi:hypothetical protein [Pedobacter sp. L105]|uniref:hypothetical protein n=1 Tax=Pedobacter sp. L105 TaxID=1641871 RepID=UPI00131C5E13|nr:hypothetical protein [Pedobacter sp. L105]
MNTQNLLVKRTLKSVFTLVLLGLAGSMSVQNVQAQSTDVTKIHFKKDKYNRIFIPVKIGRDSLTLLLGTYSKTLRVTPYFMKTNALSYSGQGITLTDAEGQEQKRLIFNMPKIRIGNLKFRNEESIVNYSFPDSIATGSTGTMMLQPYNWKIDNDKDLLSISKTPFEPYKTYTTIRYKNDSYPKAPVEMDGFKGIFALDLGSGSNFEINADSDLGRHLIMKYDLQPVNTVTSIIHGRKTVDVIYEVKIPMIRFNGIVLKNQKVILSSASPRDVIGTGFLSKYNVILNNSKKKNIDNILILEKRAI